MYDRSLSLLTISFLLSTSAALAQQQEIPAPDFASTFPGFMGQSGAFTTRFDNAFNPAMAVVFDAVGTVSESDDGALNDARLRLFEIDLASRIDPLGWAYAVIAFEDDGEEGEVALEEGAMWLDDALPGNFSLRGGKYLADFGKWNTIHLHDRAYVFMPGPAEEFFGGELNVSGLELHHWFGAGDLPVRWSFGVAPRFGGHADGHGEEAGGEEHGGTAFAAEALGRRTPSQFLYTSRITAQHDVGASGFFQWGVSAIHTPAGLAAPADTDADGEPDEEFEAGQSTLALDLTLRLPDPSARTAHTASLELYANRRDAWDAGGATLVERDANGLWGYYEYSFSPSWSAGAFGSWNQEAGSDRGAEWFTGAESASSRALFATWTLSHYNRIRLQLGQESPADGETSWTAALQWTVVLGNHAHPLDW
jgi:hypothetical protein